MTDAVPRPKVCTRENKTTPPKRKPGRPKRKVKKSSEGYESTS